MSLPHRAVWICKPITKDSFSFEFESSFAEFPSTKTKNPDKPETVSTPNLLELCIHRRSNGWKL